MIDMTMLVYKFRDSATTMFINGIANSINTIGALIYWQTLLTPRAAENPENTRKKTKSLKSQQKVQTLGKTQKKGKDSKSHQKK